MPMMSCNRVNDLQGSKRIQTDSICPRFVQNAKHRHDILILWLRDELSQDSNIVERPLGIGVAHRSIQPTDRSQTTRVIPTVLTSWDSMEVEIDSKTVFACPSNRFEEVANECSTHCSKMDKTLTAKTHLQGKVLLPMFLLPTTRGGCGHS